MLEKVPDQVSHQLRLGVIGDFAQARVLPLEAVLLLLIQVSMHVNIFENFSPQLCPEQPQSTFKLKALDHCVLRLLVHF